MNVTFGDVRFSPETLSSVTFNDVDFLRSDLSAVRWRGCIIEGGIFKEILISDTTRLDLDLADSTPTFMGLRVVDGDSVLLVYDPSEVTRWLVKIGAAASGAASALLPMSHGAADGDRVLVERLCAAFRHGNPLPEDEVRMRKVIASEGWRAVKEALLETGLITVENRSASGPKRDFYRRHFLPEELQSGASTDPRVAKFWKLLRG